MQERKNRPKPFENSLSALAQVALTEIGADGYAFFRRSPDSPEFSRIFAYGADIPEDPASRPAAGLTSYTLGSDGLLVFTFHDAGRRENQNPQVVRIVKAIESVWNTAQNAIRYSELASHVAELETRLMDSRISDRVRGYLGDHPRRNEGPEDSFEAIERHVEGVLNPGSAGRALEKLSQELEQEVEERRLTNRAKAILRSVHGMSEEQAHHHIRQTSRKTRRKVRDVAADLIERHPEPGDALRGR
jgi:hypothetical protein